MDIIWSLLLGAVVGATFSRVGWGYKYLGARLDTLLARFR